MVKGLIVAQVSFVQVVLFCEEKFNGLLNINLSYKVSFPRRPFRRHESRILLRIIKITRELQLRYAFITLAAVSPDPLFKKCLWL